mmetsp:Transcript_27530/g.60950  ORF Transcript_27530/g.60950 Transcript_27530/m.60950 type:complete len:309 (+) Transcript_27530:156-1082(+)
MEFARHTTKDVPGYTKAVHDLKWNREGNFLGMVSADKTVKIGQLDRSGAFQNVHSIPNSSQMIQLCWHSNEDSRLAICGDDKNVEIWDVRGSRAAMKIPTMGNNINVAWSPSGNNIVVGNRNDVLTVIDVRKGQQLTKKKFLYEVNELAWSANDQYLFSATGGDGVGAVDVLSMENGELTVVDTIVGHVSNSINLKVDPLYRRMAVGSLDLSISLWDLESLTCTATCPLEQEVRSMSFSGDGTCLAVATDDTSVLIVDCASGASLAKVEGRSKLHSLSWHPKQNVLAVAVDDRSPVPQFLRFYSFAQG